MRLLPTAFELIRRDLVRRGARSVYAEVGGTRVHYYDVPGKGTAPPLVLVHGLGGHATGWSRILLPLAKESRRVVALDMPGSGFSPVPSSGAFGLNELVASFEKFFEQEVGEPSVIIGNSLGGALSARFSAKRQDVVAGTILVAPAGAPCTDDRWQQLLRHFRMNTVDDARALTKRLFHRPPVLFPLVVGRDLMEMYGTPAVSRVLLDADQSFALSPEELKALGRPTLLLWGKSERVLPYEMIEFFRTHMPAHVEIEEVEGFGHVPHVEKPRALVDRIRVFLRHRLN